MEQNAPATQLLVVHHTPSPAVHELLSALVTGVDEPELAAVTVRIEPALSATPHDVLTASAIVLLTPANIGYMSGALKHFFDTVYYPCLDSTAGTPFGLVVHGNDDTTGAVRSVERITSALRWQAVASPLSVVGQPGPAELSAARQLAATVAACALGL